MTAGQDTIIVEPVPPPPGRSPVAAALLNLTGLALGYAYLRRWWRFGVYLTGAVVLVALAFLTRAADTPLAWQAIAAIWLVWTAVDALLIGMRTPAPSARRQILPVAVALVAVAAVVAGYLAYAAAGDRAYAAGVEVQGRADCSAATAEFTQVTGLYELTLSPNVRAAEVRTVQCTEFTTAAAERQAGDYAAAVGRYRSFRTVHPGTELVPFVTTELHGTFADWGRAGRDSGDYSGAISVYEDALTEPDAPDSVRVELAATYLERAADTRADATGLSGYQAAVTDALTVADEFGDTPSASLVPVSLADTYAAAAAPVAQQRFCDAIPALDYFVGLTHPAAAAVVGSANADRARSLFECGLGRYRGGDGAGSLEALEPFVGAYPNDPGILQARSAVVAATIADAKGAPLPPLPGPLSGDNVGPVAYTIYNDSPYEVRVLLNGPTTHEVVIPPCPDCGSGYGVPPPDCPSRPGLPSVTLRLLVGVYDDLAFSPSQPDVNEVVDTNNFEPGFDYSACYYPILGN